MLRDIVVDLISDAGDVEVADEVPAAQAVDALERTQANVVISGQLNDQLVAQLLGARAAAGVLTVSDDGHDGTLHRFSVQTTRLGELSPERLLAVARSCLDPPR